MADAIRKVEYFSILVPNTPAKAFGVLSTLVSSGVNLLACSGIREAGARKSTSFPTTRASSRRAVKKAGLAFTPEKSGFMIQGRDRPGALTEHLKKLGDKGINVTGIDALSAGEGRWGAIIWVDDEAVRQAGRVLGRKAENGSGRRRESG